MKFWEAMKAMEEGKKVRKVNWEDEAYIYINENSEIRDNEDFYPALYCINEEWEIYDDRKEVDPRFKEFYHYLKDENGFANGQYIEFLEETGRGDHLLAFYMQLLEMSKYYKLD